MQFPLCAEIPYFNPLQLLQLVADKPYTVFLDSSRQQAELGRYSFIGYDPFAVVEMRDSQTWLDGQPVTTAGWELLKTMIARYQCDNRPGEAPFQGGWMGLLGYDLNQTLEKLPRPDLDDMQFKDFVMAYFDVVIAFDHITQSAWIYANGFPERSSDARQSRAKARLTKAKALIQQACQQPLPTPSSAVIARASVRTPFTATTYQAQVEQFIEYILAGDIFEGTMSQRFTAPMPDLSCFALYERLRRFNPAPFSAFLNLKDEWILSASPERFLKLSGQQVETRPIKGTVKRSADPKTDSALAQALYASEKDRAENVMIVDLMRNDLSRVCQPGTIHVPQLCEVESYETVHHLVSVVNGALQPDQQAVDLLKATFPGGSVTGAPKIRAMEIIAALEPTARGPYCGSIGYIGANGDMDTSIVIRTFAIKQQIVTFQVGSAITADSSPAGEYNESLVKAAALIKTLTEYESSPT